MRKIDVQKLNSYSDQNQCYSEVTLLYNKKYNTYYNFKIPKIHSVTNSTMLQ